MFRVNLKYSVITQKNSEYFINQLSEYMEYVVYEMSVICIRMENGESIGMSIFIIGVEIGE